jgi:uncharacterized membrane protein (DUF485 family)
MATPSFPNYSTYFPDPYLDGDDGTDTGTHSVNAPAHNVHDDPDFREVRRAYRTFGATAALIAVGSFLLYVLLSCFAPVVMDLPLIGNITVGLVIGLLQFVVMGATAYLYAVRMRTRIDPLVDRFRDEAAQAGKGEAPGRGQPRASKTEFGDYHGEGQSSGQAPGQAQESARDEWRYGSW